MKNIWSKINDKKSLYHVEVILLANIKSKEEEENNFHYSPSHLLRSVSLVDEDYKDQRAVILEE